MVTKWSQTHIGYSTDNMQARRLMSAKGGLMMGTKKVGALPSRQKRANIIIAHFARIKCKKDWNLV